MTGINPRDPSLLTDEDVEYAHFKCCGDEDLVFLRCPSCGHIWVQCYECETWFTDLNDLTKTASAFLSTEAEHLNCPKCMTPFEDYFHLMEGFVDKYLPSAPQVIEAGFGKHLARHLREKHGVCRDEP
jgi:hypothetical protein